MYTSETLSVGGPATMLSYIVPSADTNIPIIKQESRDHSCIRRRRRERWCIIDNRLESLVSYQNRQYNLEPEDQVEP
jgi:hypothetical protein